MQSHSSPSLLEAPSLDGDEVRVLDEIEALRARMRHLIQQEPRRWIQRLRRNLQARAIQGSNSIEGIDVTLDDAAAAVAGDEPLDADDATWKEITGYQNAMTFVLQLHNDPHFQMNEMLLRSLHFMMMSHDLSMSPGQWRAGDIYVRREETGKVVYQGPDAADVPALVTALLDELDGKSAHDVPPLVRAAMAHLNLVLIHPFRDGNGRMSRCLQTLVIAREGILAPEFSSIEEYLGRNTQEYYDVLGQVGGGHWDKRGDVKPWVRFILAAHHIQATTVLRRMNESERLWGRLSREAESSKLPERAIAALYDAAQGWRVRNSMYRTDADIEQYTAARDLRHMVDAGLLIARGQNRGRHYVASESLREIRAEVRGSTKRAVNPFVQA